MYTEEFDYHLTPSEQEQVEKCVPLHQAKIHLAFRAKIQVDSKVIDKGAVALSEHMITICTPGFLRKSFKYYASYHLFDIHSVMTITDEQVRMEIKDSIIYITSPACMRFVRNTLRNFILSNPSLPAKLRFNFKCHDPSFFPPFQPQLSPSQVFQFTYNAYCSYLDATYYHDIPMYYHKLLQTGNCIFDLTKLPLKVLECGLGDAADIKPITNALLYSPFIHGFSCENFVRPDILTAISPLVETNQALKVVRIVDAGAERGAIDLANAMLRSVNQNVVFWDLSKNRIEDLLAFAQALGEYEGEVRSIILNDCDMNDMTVGTLFQSLCDNESMHEIEELQTLGSRINRANGEILIEMLEELGNEIEDSEEPISLKVLCISQVEDPNAIIATLKIVKAQLLTFKLHDTVLNDAGVMQLCDFLQKQKRLCHFSLDGCTLPPLTIVQLIATIGMNPNITNISVSLGRMKLTGLTFEILLQSLLDHLSKKLTSLSLDGNKMTVEDLSMLCSRINGLKVLKSISLSQNFYSTQRGIGSALCGLINSPTLEEIIIRGDDQYKLKQELIPFICQMHLSKTLHSIDISFNSIGDMGLETLANLVISSLILTQVAADGSDPSSIDSIDRFLYVLETDAQLVGAPLPVEDLYLQVSEKEEKLQSKLIEKITYHQMKLDEILMQNRARNGMHSDLTFLHDPILDDILDSSTLQMAELLRNCNLNQHLAITEIVGLPLPFEKDSEQSVATALSREQNEEPQPAVKVATEKYDVEANLMSQITEKQDDLMSQLQTLQFNSLLIRRPNAAERLANKAAAFLKPSTFDPSKNDDEYEEEEEEEEEEYSEEKKRVVPSNIEMLAPIEFDVENAPSPLTPTEMADNDLNSPLV